MLKCPSCNKWEKNINDLNTCITSAFIHDVKYEGEVMVYCPWCGAKLEEVQKDEN